MTGPLVLPEDVQIVPLAGLPASARARIGGESQDYAVTRPRSRATSKVIDAQAAALLREFEKPTTLVEAILRFSRATHRNPSDVLEDVYPFLESCLVSKLLVEPGWDAESIQPTLAVGDYMASYRVEECVQVLADSELYRVSAADCEAALKIARPGAGPEVALGLEREARILGRLNGRVAPRLLASGNTQDGRTHVVTEWISGELCSGAAAALRITSRRPIPHVLLALCGKVLDAYATLHSLGVIHSDVHPRNLLAAANGEIRIIDYGLSRIDDDGDFATAPRGGVGFFLDPEYATAELSHSMPPPSTRAGEQFSVSALIYYLLTGHYYLDFSLEKEAVLRQIVEQLPVPLAARGLVGRVDLDRILLRALSKDPSARFPDMNALAVAFHEAATGSVSSPQTMTRPAGAADRPSRDLHHAREWLDSFLDLLSDPMMVLPVYPTPATSLFDGAAGIGYALFRIACVREDAKLSALASRWLDRAGRDHHQAAFYSSEMKLTPKSVGRKSPYYSPAGIACLEALLAHSTGDFYSCASAAERLVKLSNQAYANPDITNGNSGTLLTLSLLVDAFRCEPDSPRQPLIEAGNRLLNSLWRHLDMVPPIGELNGDTSLGMAHGWAGYLYATLRWMQSAQAHAPANLKIRLEQLAGQVRWHGNCASLPFQVQPNSPNFGGWCNGSAGFVFLWSLTHRLLRDVRWLELAEGAGRDVCHPRDEGYDLCCGLCGKAYSQLHLYKHTGDRVWLDNATAMAMSALRQAQLQDENVRRPIPFSLYKGKLGLAVLISDLDSPESSAMPFFEDEGWPASLG